MKRLPISAVLLATFFTTIAHAEEPVRGVKAITVPEAFVVEEVAAPPVTERPLMGGFDDRGRLYLAESSGENLDAKELLARTPNFIRRLEDSDGDGRFDKSTMFADKMTFPMGALWYRGSVYSASPPYIWKLTDADNDGIADKRDILVGKFGFIGNAADIHGCFLGPQGRLYWCDGRHGHEFIDENGKVVSTGKAARIFSCRLDGSDVIAHAGGGMDNPVEVDFVQNGAMLGVVNLFYPKRGDCLVHWLDGGVYPREDQPVQIAEFRRTGDLLGPVHDFGHVAVSGTLRYRSKHFGPEFFDNWFVCEFNTHKIARVVLSRAGSTFKATTEPFLSSSDPDFHPTDVIEDADGTLLVVDTGGWFRNGCPTSQVAKPQITGGLYRIRRADRKTSADPRGLALSWDNPSHEELAARLTDDRPAVRERAIDTLAQFSTDPVPAIAAVAADSNSPRVRMNAVWTYARLATPSARDAIIAALEDKDQEVRQSAAVSLQTLREPKAESALIKTFSSDIPAVQREVAVALMRLQSHDAVPVLLAGLTSPFLDRPLEHAIIYALIEINDRDQTAKGLAHESSAVRRGTLIALDQMESGNLTREEVAPLLDTEDADLQKAAIDVIAKRSGWSEELLGHLKEWLADKEWTPARTASMRGALLAFRQDAKTQQLVEEVLMDKVTSPHARRLLLEVINRSDFEKLPEGWRRGLLASLGITDEPVLLEAISAAAKWSADFAEPLAKLVADTSRGETVRGAAAAAMGQGGLALDESAWSLLASRLDEDRPALERMSAAEALGNASLTQMQRQQLVALIAKATPVELPALIRAFEKPPFQDKLGGSLADALGSSPGLAALSAGRLQEILRNYSPAIQQKAKSLSAQLGVDQEKQAARLATLEPQIGKGDIARGEAVFRSAKASCAACHAVGNSGGAIGPDLTKIGASRTTRDLLESVLYPSNSFARGYESFNVLTAGGKVHAGLIARETADAVWLRTVDRSEVRIPRFEIDEVAPSPRSVMPEGLDRMLSEREIIDLTTYLSSLK